MYQPLNKHLLLEWSKNKYVYTSPCIYFQKRFQFLPQHKSQLIGLRKNKNMTSKSGSVRSADFLPYVLQTPSEAPMLCF